MTRLAIVIDRLRPDVERLMVELSRFSDLLVVSDERAPKIDSVCDAIGAELLVASHRRLMTNDGLVPSDLVLAASVTDSHRSRPLDAIIYATDALTDLAAFSRDLTSVPVGRVGSGMVMRANVTLASAKRMNEEGAHLIALAGACAIADFSVNTHARTPLNSQLTPKQLELNRELPTSSVEGVVDVVGLGLEETLGAVMQTAETHDQLVTVVGSDPLQGEVLLEMLPADLGARTVFALEEDDWASDLTGVNLRSVGAGEASGQETIEVPGVRPRPAAVTVDATALGDLAVALESETAANSDRVVLALIPGSPPADELEGQRAMLADIAFAADGSTTMGDVDPRTVRDDVLAIGPRARGIAALLAREAEDLRGLIHRLTDPMLTSSAVVGFFRTERSGADLTFRVQRTHYDSGDRLVPALLPIPNAPIEPGDGGSGRFDPKGWVGSKRWSTRWRLALPWRWGLLPRSMKGRW